MAHTITDEERKQMEDFIARHEPYPDDAKEVNCFDYPSDPCRGLARIYKKYLAGELNA